MKIVHKKVKIQSLIIGYKDSGENGIVGYGGKLNIRPVFQREFIYAPNERDAVIRTVRAGYPLNIMYWSDDGNGNFELMDGQQRTVSICQYVTEIIPIKFNNGYELAFNNLTHDQKKEILDYELSIYLCQGSESEKLAWFKTINIAGKPLTNQELLNALHTGPWLSDAKRFFSKVAGPAYKIGEKYLKGSANRQDYLEKALIWVSNEKVERYMNLHRQDKNALALWQNFKSIIDWTESVFFIYRKIMKGLEWGHFYNKYKEKTLNPTDLENQIINLIEDDDVNNKKGIYEFLLSGNERTLGLRNFNQKTREMQYHKQKGICPICNKHFDICAMEADHIVPWRKGGKTVADNCQMLCELDNRKKSGN